MLNQEFGIGKKQEQTDSTFAVSLAKPNQISSLVLVVRTKFKLG